MAAPHSLRSIRCPMLWDEAELSVFVALLGISPEASRRIQQRRLKGATQLVDLSNTEMRRDLGLGTPVERLVVRRALHRILEVDRWGNSIGGRDMNDVLKDTVLSEYIVPLEELSLVGLISQGGYGQVYKGALQPPVDRAGLRAGRQHIVAVKEMKGKHRVRLYELLKEACVMASLSHPNICRFIGVCADDSPKGKRYIISELMNCSLFDVVHTPHKLKWHGDLTLTLVMDLSGGIAAGIAYIHGRKLVHADMKSSNVLIDFRSSWKLVPRICDFGHAAVRSYPVPHHRCGTPHWAAPEVLRSEALGPAADVYSFGVLLWEMLTRELPHSGLSFGQVVASVGWAGWLPDFGSLPLVPREVRQLLKDCLNFSPADRPPSEHLERCLQHIPRRAKEQALTMLDGFLDGD